MITIYNKENIGDVLLIIIENDEGKENKIERKENVTQISLMEEPEKVVAWNIFNVSEILGEIKGQGQVFLSDTQIDKLNQVLQTSGFTDKLINDQEPKFVVGYVKTCEKLPNSDHLSITQTEVDHGEVLQIICGAPNIQAGQKVIVAKSGAMMPDGQIIWPGALRGVESFGMICSANELGLKNAPSKKGIMVLSDDAKIGEPYNIDSQS
ncbi:YtpR family tRNA-binding protein [Melissococcus plutonius]|uniref:tRNA binding domain protein n=1 Tax=Melissococcus plutonius (strain ATCC 35311 / DSM 29964 / CIP 104052 / LMG 20360 / NCIMB 702443) TaxID=940190 RepID=F3Y7Z1_MELPT|nr:DUF4479 and tRNA-binding domain-containing protein [Melissococcus plutonius]AIM24373.1 putative tRNA-binding protein YtpR [Melissococcus plutonius S1]KMT25763.1 putative tRNA-binding protein YtpR [Melissococcus plutonius]KMT27108.1 putative tRNA-binding protein YtpR [Melissococcus plutonius]KMT28209.1 putative tRNA-binding protein YtpR [Melissococcus plutonius]KMT29946.1 putative tRNA-binding protein YtpR [Melissococcus plutonius]